MKSITVTDSANGDGSLYIADGARGGNIPKSWADAIFQHKLSEIGLYWVEKEKTFVVTESLVQLDGELLHQEITAPTCGSAAWTFRFSCQPQSCPGVRVLRSRIRLLSLVGETSRYKYCHIM